jgi:hypothetical protein
MGVFVTEPVAAGTPVLRLPNSLMLTTGKNHMKQALLALTLARERRNASSAVMAAFVESLPIECPANLATRPQADLDLVEQTLHSWKVSTLKAQRQVFAENPPLGGSDGEGEHGTPTPPAPWTEEEVRWATCMSLSRAFAGVKSGPVMMPFVDLINHDSRSASCTEKGVWLHEEGGKWQAELVAARDLAAGDEVTFSYSESASKARMITSFGFTEGSPSAVLAAAELPEREASWLSSVGCAHKARTELNLDTADDNDDDDAAEQRLPPGAPPPPPKTPTLSDEALRDAIRCIRLRLYTPVEARWALSNGHLDAPWGGWPHLPRSRTGASGGDGGDGGDSSSNQEEQEQEEEDLFASILGKDLRIVQNTATMCAQAQTEEQVEMQTELMRFASEDLRSAVREETLALAACAHGFSRAHYLIEKRGMELFG